MGQLAEALGRRGRRRRGLRGEKADFELGRDHQAVFSVFYPVGDGSRLLIGDELGGSAIVTVADGRIVSRGPAPVKMGDRPPGNWQRNVLRDSSAKLWVMTNWQTEHSMINAVGGISQAIDSRGKLVATHDGWLMLEDRRKGLWFKLAGWNEKRDRASRPQRPEASLEVPGLTDAAPFAEAPDGTVWTLTSSDLIRLAADGRHLSVVATYPMACSRSENICCDPRGRVWVEQGNSSFRELAYLATPPDSSALNQAALRPALSTWLSATAQGRAGTVCLTGRLV